MQEIPLFAIQAPGYDHQTRTNRLIAETVDAVAAVMFSPAPVRPVLPQEGDPYYPEFWEHHNAGY